MIFSKFERMVAGRYLRAKRKEGFISVITGFAFTGIALGVATLIIVMSVMNGFKSELLSRILGINGHIMIVAAPGFPFTNYKTAVQDVQKIAGVELAVPMIEKQILILQGIVRGKNVIILQLESIQNFVINKEINGKEITPNLNKFINENIEISNMFMQSYSSTADSEFSATTSLYPMENGMSYSRYYTNKYDNIFTMFENEGYTTSYMHGNYGFFWNRGNVYKSYGVENIELKDSFADT